MADESSPNSGNQAENEQDTPSGKGYRDALHGHLQDMVQVLAIQKIIREHERELASTLHFTDDGNEVQDRHSRQTRLELLLLEAYEQHRLKGLTEQEALQAVIGDLTASPNMKSLMTGATNELLAEIAEINVGEEIHFLRQTAPEVFETLGAAETQTMSFTIAVEKRYREEMGERPLLAEWKEKLSDPDSRRQLLNAGLKYGGYALTAAALVSTFPVGTPVIIAKQLIARNQPFIAETASKLASMTASSLVRHGIVSPETVEVAKNRYLALDEKTKSNRLLKNGKKLLGIGLTVLIAGSLGIYSESMDFSDSPKLDDSFAPPEGGEVAEPLSSDFAPSEGGEEEPLSSELLSEVGLLSIDEQKAFMDSMHELALQNDIDYHHLTPHEIIDQLPSQAVETLRDLSSNDLPQEVLETAEPIILDDVIVDIANGDTLSDIIARELSARGIPFDASTLYGDGDNPGLVEVVAQANPHIQNPDLIYEDSTLTMPGEVFKNPDSMVSDITPGPNVESAAAAPEQPSSEHSALEKTPHSQAEPVEAPNTAAINAHLQEFNPEQTEAPQPSVDKSSVIPKAEDVISSISNMEPDQKYAAVAALRDIATLNNLDFMATPPEVLYDQLPGEAKLQLVEAIHSFESDAAAAGVSTMLDPEAVTASREVGTAALQDQQQRQLESLTIGGWLAQKNQALISWFKDTLTTGNSSQEASLTASTALSQDELEGSAGGTAKGHTDALRSTAQEIASQPGYQKPDYPDVLNPSSSGEQDAFSKTTTHHPDEPPQQSKSNSLNQNSGSRPSTPSF